MNFNLKLSDSSTQDALTSCWNSYLETGNVVRCRRSISTQSLLFVAQAAATDVSIRPRPDPSAVTHFTGWVRSLYLWLNSNKKAMELGKKTEKTIDRYRRRNARKVNGQGQWQLIHNGVDDVTSSPLSISSLSIRGKPLLGSPDYVFEERGTGRILILEIKTTTRIFIPADGWPDMRAQLWAYGQIDKWKDAPEVILAAEIWEGESDPTLRGIVSWNKTEQPFDDDNRMLFDSYHKAIAKYC